MPPSCGFPLRAAAHTSEGHDRTPLYDSGGRLRQLAAVTRASGLGLRCKCRRQPPLGASPTPILTAPHFATHPLRRLRSRYAPFSARSSLETGKREMSGFGFVSPICFAIKLSNILAGRSLSRVQFLKRCGMTA